MFAHAASLVVLASPLVVSSSHAWLVELSEMPPMRLAALNPELLLLSMAEATAPMRIDVEPSSSLPAALSREPWTTIAVRVQEQHFPAKVLAATLPAALMSESWTMNAALARGSMMHIPGEGVSPAVLMSDTWMMSAARPQTAMHPAALTFEPWMMSAAWPQGAMPPAALRFEPWMRSAAWPQGMVERSGMSTVHFELAMPPAALTSEQWSLSAAWLRVGWSSILSARALVAAVPQP